LRKFRRVVYLDSGSLGPSPEVITKAQTAWLRLRNQIGPAAELTKKIIEGGLVSVPELRRDYPSLINWSGIEHLRKKAAAVLGCEKDEIIFTQNTSDAIKWVLSDLRLTREDEILTTDLEHDSTLYNCACAHSQWKTQVSQVTLSDLLASSNFESESVKRIQNAITKHTRLVILSHISYSSGVILPINKIARACKDRNPSILVLVDGAHSLGLVPLSVNKFNCDFFASSGTKWLLAPEGTGILFIRKELLQQRNGQLALWPSAAYQVSQSICLSPESSSGIMQNIAFDECGEPRAVELGTANITSLIGLDSALDEYLRQGPSNVAERVTTLSQFAVTLLKEIGDVDLPFTSNNSLAPGIVCFKIAQLVSYKDICQFINILQEEYGIICRAIPKPPCIRLSIHHFNTETDLRQMASAVRKVALQQTNVNQSMCQALPDTKDNKDIA